jgi:hypothetical protein
VPLGQRPLDVLLLVFFALNLFCITYLIDIEQITVVDVAHPEAAVWPPQAVVRFIHDFGRKYDPALMAREAYWRGGIYFDILLYGPFYAFALYAYARGREWIRVPTLLWGASIFTSTGLIVFEELWGVHAAPNVGVTLQAYAAYLVLPLVAIARMAFTAHPFSRQPAAFASPAG